MFTTLQLVWFPIQLYTHLQMNLYIAVEMLLHNLSHSYCVDVTGVIGTH